MRLEPGNCNKPDHFIELYQKLLSERCVHRILEIGVQRGDSLRMWANAFPKAEVLGLDLENLAGVLPANVRMISGNQRDTELLETLGYFDFIVDDGSHMTGDQQVSFTTLFPRLNKGGVYVIEDLELNREEEFKNTSLSTSEFFAAKLQPATVYNVRKPTFLAEGIKSITFADNLLVVEKL